MGESHELYISEQFSKRYLIIGEDDKSIQSLFKKTIVLFFEKKNGTILIEGNKHLLVYYELNKLANPEKFDFFLEEAFMFFDLFATYKEHANKT